MNPDFLNIEIRLLLAKYGKRRVFESLAQISDTNIEEIEAEIRELAAKKAPRKRTPKNSDQLIAELVHENGKKSDLQDIVRSYEMRFFLPNLRDVSAFLDRNGIERKKLKSRRDALRLVLQVLASFPKDRLTELKNDITKYAGTNDYSLLAHQILGKDSKTNTPQ